MTDSNQMTKGLRPDNNCLRESDKIVIHRKGQNYTITYGQLLDNLQPFFGDAGGDARLIFTDNGELVKKYQPSDRVATTIDLGAGGEDNVQSDWKETDTDSAAFIKNKPDDPETGMYMPYDLNTLTQY